MLLSPFGGGRGRIFPLRRGQGEDFLPSEGAGGGFSPFGGGRGRIFLTRSTWFGVFNSDTSPPRSPRRGEGWLSLRPNAINAPRPCYFPPSENGFVETRLIASLPCPTISATPRFLTRGNIVSQPSPLRGERGGLQIVSEGILELILKKNTNYEKKKYFFLVVLKKVVLLPRFFQKRLILYNNRLIL